MSEDVKPTRPEKKSETIEVRVSYTEKLAFMEACRNAGTTASHAIRDYIGGVLQPNNSEANKTRLVIGLGLVLTASLTAVGVFLFQREARPATTGERVVRYFDQNGDGTITAADAENTANKETIDWLLETGDQNSNGRIEASEVDNLAQVMIEVRGDHPERADGAGEQVIVIPPNLTPKERQAFLKRAGIPSYVGTEDQAKLARLIDALTLPSGETKTSKPD